MKSKLESSIQSSILSWLSTQDDCFTFKVITANKRGIPDIVGCKNGKFFAFEVKAKNGIVSENQKYQMEKIRKCGGFCEVVKSLDEVKHILSLNNI